MIGGMVGGILSDGMILAAMSHKEIIIEPFDRAALGGNSYDVHLSPYLKTYALGREESVFWGGDGIVRLDCKVEPKTVDHVIPDNGFVFYPGTLYLGSTLEYTETHDCVPYLDGKSSIGRLGIQVHATAGRGDVGFCNHWTFEITVVHPVRVYAGMAIGQLTYHTVFGHVNRPYNTKASAKYTKRDPKPQASRMWKNFVKETTP